jgi:hypothetical protein
MTKNIRAMEMDFQSLEDVERAWAEASGDSLLDLGSMITKMLGSGSFGSDNWKFEIEKEFMDKHDLVYLKSEARIKTMGCIAKAATRAKNDVKRPLDRKGKESHGMVVSRRGPTVTEKDDNCRRQRKKKSKSFVPEYVRKSEMKDQSRFKGLKDGDEDRVEENEETRDSNRTNSSLFIPGHVGTLQRCSRLNTVRLMFFSSFFSSLI